MTLPEFETIEYHHPALNLNLICEEEDGEWTGEMPGPDGELFVRLPSSSTPTPSEASLKALTWAQIHLPELRQEAVRFARADVLGDLDRWGFIGEDGVPFWETYSEMPRWPEMDEAAFSSEFTLMGLIIPEDGMEGTCVLGFDTSIDDEHGVGILFQAELPVELESWCDY